MHGVKKFDLEVIERASKKVRHWTIVLLLTAAPMFALVICMACKFMSPNVCAAIFIPLLIVALFATYKVRKWHKFEQRAIDAYCGNIGASSVCDWGGRFDFPPK